MVLRLIWILRQAWLIARENTWLILIMAKIVVAFIVIVDESKFDISADSKFIFGFEIFGNNLTSLDISSLTNILHIIIQICLLVGCKCINKNIIINTTLGYTSI